MKVEVIVRRRRVVWVMRVVCKWCLMVEGVVVVVVVEEGCFVGEVERGEGEKEEGREGTS